VGTTPIADRCSFAVDPLEIRSPEDGSGVMELLGSFFSAVLGHLRKLFYGMRFKGQATHGGC
jgi:hypothetical protein